MSVSREVIGLCDRDAVASRFGTIRSEIGRCVVDAGGGPAGGVKLLWFSVALRIAAHRKQSKRKLYNILVVANYTGWGSNSSRCEYYISRNRKVKELL